MQVYTREQYLKDSQADSTGSTHRKYFGQFVTPETIHRVISSIGPARILASNCRHFNDIPLKEWDSLACMLPGTGGFTRAGDYYTLGNGVCLAKEAARQWKEAQQA